MKLTAVQNMKFLRLKRALKMPSWQVVGVLESIWLFTQVSAPAGDIGRYSNEDIAAHLEWDGDADALVGVLVQCGWLDVHQEHRLVVHDWQDHAPNFVKGNMAKHGKHFATDSAKHGAKQHAKQPAKHGASEAALAPCSTTPSNVPPNVMVCNETKRIDTAPSGDAGLIASDEPEEPATKHTYSLAFETFWTIYPAYRRTGKGAAWKAWQRAIKTANAEHIVDAAEEYAASPVGSGEFSKSPATWLNQRCWEDDRAAWGSPPEKKQRLPTAEERANWTPH